MMEVESISCMSSADPLSQHKASLDKLAGAERSPSPLEPAPQREPSPDASSQPNFAVPDAPSPGQAGPPSLPPPLDLAPQDSQPESEPMPMEEEDPFEDDDEMSQSMMEDPMLSHSSSTVGSPPPHLSRSSESQSIFPDAPGSQSNRFMVRAGPVFPDSPRGHGGSGSPAGGTSSPQSGAEGGQIKRKARRKQTIEDIVRRINKPDEQYQSDESEEEDPMNGSMPMATGARSSDEVDGGSSKIENHLGPSFKFPNSTGALPFPPSHGSDRQQPILSPPRQQQELQQQHQQHQPQHPPQPHHGSPKQQQQQQQLTPQHHHQHHSHHADVKREPSFPPSSNGGLPPSITMASNISESAYSPHASYKTAMTNGWYHNFSSMPPFMYPPSPMDPMVRKFMPFDSPMVTGDVEKDYLKCQYCERTFRRQKNLENHVENTHQGKGTPKRTKEGNEMYFKCTHCPYTTKHQSNLYVHLRIHTGERPYICGACGVQYSQSHSLKSHIINKHDGIMSYYIKEKRNRSPRGMSYMTTPVMPEHPMFRLHQPLLHSPLPPSGLDMPSLPPSIKTSVADQFSLGMPGHPLMQSSPSTPMLNGHGHASPHYGDVPHNRASGALPSLTNGSCPSSHAPSLPPFTSSPAMSSSSLGNGMLGSGHHQSQPPAPHHPHPPSSSGFGGAPGSRMAPGQPESAQACGAIDLSKKSNGREGLLHGFPGSRSDGRQGSRAECCGECNHKLKLLRHNVVRMLGILVPTLNFEEKGISPDSDSVDELLQDVIESNIQDDDPAE